MKGNPPPIPFKRASPPLHDAFLAPELSKKHVYITHLDTHPASFKKKIFAVPVLMNVAIVCLLLYRATTIGPYYIKIAQSLAGHRNETSIDATTTPTPRLLAETLRRTGTFLLDLGLCIFLAPWPRSFFLGRPANPISWRRRVGFRDTEIIVRRSRPWDRRLGDVVREGAQADDAGTLFLARVTEAVAPARLAKTGYLLLDRHWDLDWRAMATAHRLVDRGTLSHDAFRARVYRHSPDFGWVSFDAVPRDAAPSRPTPDEPRAEEAAGRKKVQAVKDALCALGQEDLFYRCIELIQFEATHPAGFGPERRAQAVDKAREMFEAHGVDFHSFWAGIGGMRHMPGFDEAS